MSRRTITEREISLIKAMLSRRMKNKDIQFFFNRPDRPVNSGRISTIRTGSYSDSAEIMEASDEELDEFIQSWPLTRGHAEPAITDKARELFGPRSDGRWILTEGENQECECKQDFDSSKTTPIVRAVAALANNNGGFIFFGVLDGDYVVRGVSKEFAQTDVVQIVDKVKAHLFTHSKHYREGDN
jgi:schlafen family protein